MKRERRTPICPLGSQCGGWPPMTLVDTRMERVRFIVGGVLVRGGRSYTTATTITTATAAAFSLHSICSIYLL